MELNYAAIIVATLAQFVFGAVWYTPVFGKTWGKIHGFDKVPAAQQKEMMKKMWLPLGIQILVTVLTTTVFAILMKNFTASWSVYTLGVLFWLGFIVPTQISAVLFGGTEPKWVVTKTLIMVGASLGCMMIAAAVLQAM